MAFAVEVPLQNLSGRHQECVSFSISRRPPDSVTSGRRKSDGVTFGRRTPNFVTFPRRNLLSISATLHAPVKSVENDVAIPIMVNSCMGKMGRAVIEAGISAGLHIVPTSFGSQRHAGRTVQVGGLDIQVHGPSDRESILASVLKEYPNLIVLDYTVPDAVNENAELYCKTGVPFVMGTTGGDRDLLYKAVQDSNLYAVISPQMGKHALGLLETLESMSKKFPGIYNGYTLEVLESHQHTKLDISGTAKAVILCFLKLGVWFDVDQLQMIRDPKQQVEMVGVPEEYLDGHAFHRYRLTSPDGIVIEFHQNVCGRSINAEGAIDATRFLAKKVQSKADKKIYDMLDVLREGSMR